MQTHSLFFVTLGCDKNTVDSEIMLSRLLDADFELVKDETKAEFIVINTCAFIEEAQQEAIDTILEMAQYKEKGCCRYLIVAGCLAERYKNEIFTELPEVDAVLGTGSYEQIVTVLLRLLSGEKQVTDYLPLDQRPLGYQKRYLTSVGYSSYLKIAEGCNNHCTYCVIPKIRGPFRSRPMNDLILEAQTLANQGVTELLLIAQDVTRYGSDLHDGTTLSVLIHELAKTEGLKWLRLLYCYPEGITDDLVHSFETEPKLLHYIDMPIQHSEDAVLKRMGRPNTRAELVSLIQTLRSRIPDLSIRTTLISGFPGETQQQHEAMMDFVRESHFTRLGVFPYSQEEGTPAAKLPGQLSDQIKNVRASELNELARTLSTEESQKLVGQDLTVLIVGSLPDDPHVYVGRSYRDAPEIDGFVFVTSTQELKSGEYVQTHIVSAYEYDLIGEAIL